MEYSYLLDQADECEDPYLRLVYACKSTFSTCFDFQILWLNVMLCVQHHGLYLFTLPTNERGSLSILFLERHMRWPTMVAFHFFLSRCSCYTLHSV